MAIDNIARGLAASLLGQDGKVASEKMPTMPSIGDTSGFVPVGKLNDAKAVAGKTAEEILLMMLFGVVNPTFTDPKLSVALVSDDVAIIGRKCSIQGALSFDRGSITPAYGTSGYRAGLPTSYVVGGVEAPIRATSYDFAIDLIPTEGDNEIICEVKYAQGEQPVNSIGEAYSEPLAAGSVSTSFVIKGVYQPYLENGKEINFVYFDDIEDGGEGYQIMASSESSGTKQSFMIHSAQPIVGIKQVDPISLQWTWLGGSPEASLKLFDTTTKTQDGVEYTVYTHNGSATGERQLRFYVAIN